MLYLVFINSLFLEVFNNCFKKTDWNAPHVPFKKKKKKAIELLCITSKIINLYNSVYRAVDSVVISVPSDSWNRLGIMVVDYTEKIHTRYSQVQTKPQWRSTICGAPSVKPTRTLVTRFFACIINYWTKLPTLMKRTLARSKDRLILF